MNEERINNLVETWFGGERTMFDECTEEPELAWLAMLRILERSLTEEETSLLAAGPLQTLLAWHGKMFIDRVEEEAATNPKFNHLLGGVWRQDMPIEIWNRVEKARKKVW